MERERGEGTSSSPPKCTVRAIIVQQPPRHSILDCHRRNTPFAFRSEVTAEVTCRVGWGLGMHFSSDAAHPVREVVFVFAEAEPSHTTFLAGVWGVGSRPHHVT